MTWWKCCHPKLKWGLHIFVGYFFSLCTCRRGSIRYGKKNRFQALRFVFYWLLPDYPAWVTYSLIHNTFSISFLFSGLFLFSLFWSVLVGSGLIWTELNWSLLFCPVLVWSVLICPVLFRLVCSLLFCSGLFCSGLVWSGLVFFLVISSLLAANQWGLEAKHNLWKCSLITNATWVGEKLVSMAGFILSCLLV